MSRQRSPALDKLQRYCADLPPGPVADESALKRLLADAWDDLQGDDGGMEQPSRSEEGSP